MTYCGKDCDVCLQREKLNCCGCTDGPGSKFEGDCVIAKCAQEKGHETCETCSFKENCSLLRSCVCMADERLKKVEAEVKRKATIAERAPVLGKWLWILFWLIIPSSVGSIMAHKYNLEILPALFWPGQVITIVTSLAYGGILLKLNAVDGRYKSAGIYALAATVVSTIATMMNGSNWALTFSLPGAIIMQISEYHQYMAHSAALSGVDDVLSGKWKVLWKWRIWILVGMVCSGVILLLVPILGLLALLAALIGVLVVEIRKLLYLFRTAKAFREISESV